ncbi:winged helix DNA-binding protein [Neobacillus sedimentimangrovi]|jgi:MarR family transcriptional regulator, organic hydroperoxide resistance regulator|uniref:Winged helix DNA-binding protein n=1 Tax=Neobacillus sedimentimangrovi TaxID=2699460 RepID=A0ABS8QJN9_9BACI|nr:winged helix DNA-binding protein [Neobacillus sedimentimangrovi]AIM16750.1 MarR family transcriptional regulator [Bacillus sp. X1(2014)]MCD4839477.1 winged helix DNA-binding protein [Neobacillus sedimentimangrovi]
MIEEIAKEYMSLIPNVFENFRELNKDSTELTHMQNHVIEYMYMQNRSLKLKEISHGLNVAKQQLTNVIKELEAEGYLIKSQDCKDKRAVLVSLTPKGKEIQDRKWGKIYQKFSENINKLNVEEQLDLKYALHKVNILLNKMRE